MKYGLLTYTENGRQFNIGDYVQSLAARQFLPRVDAFVNRETLAQYNGDPIKIILNGWFTHNVLNWVPSEKIHPLFISFHVNSSAAPYLLHKRALEYLKKYEPIGCRDKYTVQLLQEKGIDAYFTGCLTLTLDNYSVNEADRGEDIYIVDPLYNYLNVSTAFSELRGFIYSIRSGAILKLFKKSLIIKKLIDSDLLKSAVYETQVLPSNIYTDEQKFTIAETLMKKYARAKLVITSRIHVALPCLAMGTPVIFINGFDSFVDTCRFDGIMNLFNRIDITENGQFKNNFILTGKINSNTMVLNYDLYKIFSNSLKERCIQFIKSPL